MLICHADEMSHDRELRCQTLFRHEMMRDRDTTDTYYILHKIMFQELRHFEEAAQDTYRLRLHGLPASNDVMMAAWLLFAVSPY